MTIVRRTAHIQENDRVKTLSGRTGRVKRLTQHGDVANVLWDDGDEFPIRVAHLTLVDDGGNGTAKHA